MIDKEKFVGDHPSLYHLSSDASWTAIKIHGLLCTSEILKRCGIISNAQRLAVYEDRRKGEVTLTSQGNGLFVVRDQKPLCWSGLNAALEGHMSPMEWIDLLNNRVFFWITLQDALKLAEAAAYRYSNRTLLEFDTKSLFEDYGSKISVTTFNVGYTMRRPKTRGLGSFQSLDSFPGSSKAIRELTILGNVENVEKHIRRVTILDPTGKQTELFTAS